MFYSSVSEAWDSRKFSERSCYWHQRQKGTIYVAAFTAPLANLKSKNEGKKFRPICCAPMLSLNTRKIIAVKYTTSAATKKSTKKAWKIQACWLSFRNCFVSCAFNCNDLVRIYFWISESNKWNSYFHHFIFEFVSLDCLWRDFHLSQPIIPKQLYQFLLVTPIFHVSCRMLGLAFVKSTKESYRIGEHFNSPLAFRKINRRIRSPRMESLEIRTERAFVNTKHKVRQSYAT